MRESANTGKLVANMVKTEKDTHVLVNYPRSLSRVLQVQAHLH